MADSVTPRKGIRLTGRFQFEVAVFIFLVLALSISLAAFLIFFTADQEFGKGFYSAHRDLAAFWKGLLPAVLIISGGVGLIASLAALAGFWRFKRDIERTGAGLLAAMELAGQGKIGADVPRDRHDHLKVLEEAYGHSQSSVRQHLEEVKGAAEKLQRTVMRLNYRVNEEGEVTLSEMKSLTSSLNNLNRELANALKWFDV